MGGDKGGERATAYILLFPVNLYMDYFASDFLAAAWWSYMRIIITTSHFWFRSIITIVLPFILCFYLNFGIIRRLRKQHQGAKLFRFATSEHRRNIRSATLMLVFVTCTYLGSNLLNVIVYTWELIDK
ncbi:hypothetical protein NECAME_17860, partial [Necator americanus]